MYKDLPTSSSPSPCRPVATHPSDSKGKTNVPCFRRKAVCHAEWGSFWCTYFNATNISINLNLFELKPQEGEKWRSCWLAGGVHAPINAPRSLPPDINPCKYHFILFLLIKCWANLPSVSSRLNDIYWAHVFLAHRLLYLLIL
jgi:hypothetical protein